MKTAALLLKELEQHGAALLGAALLVGCIQIVTWVSALFENQLTLMESARGVSAFTLPVFAMYLASRLVVHEHARGTHEFLGALPISPAHRVLTRFAVGLGALQAVGATSLALTAAVASRREGLPLDWLAQLAGQQVVHLWAWFGVAFGVAHLGANRWLAWWLLVCASMARELHLPGGPTLSWIGMMSDSFDMSRSAPPWGAVAPAVAWGSGGLGLALFASGWRGGALVERWFHPTTSHQRARLLGAGVAALLAVDVFEGLIPARDAWEALPAVPARRATVRVAGSPDGPLWAAGARVAASLDQLGAALGVETWPPVVLIAEPAEPGGPTTRRVPNGDDELARVLLVDPSLPPDELDRQVLAQALHHRLGALASWDHRARLALDGAAPWWLGADVELLRARARRAAALGPIDPDRWLEQASDLGPELAAAAAWSQLVALESASGRDAVLDRLRDVLGPGWRGPIDGVRLRRHARAHSFAIPPVEPSGPVPPTLSLGVEQGEVVARWPVPLADGAFLEWAVLDALQTHPLPDERGTFDAIDPGAERAVLNADPSSHPFARLVVWDPELRAHVTGAWVRLR